MENKLTESSETRCALGAWMFLREPLLAEAASKQGYDYVCIDLQHGLAGFDQLPSLLQGVSTGPAAALARVPWNESWMIGRALDAGAVGVIVPMVNTAQEAADAVAACQYAPAGERSIGPIGAMIRHDNYFRHASEVQCFAMIETVEALANLEEIAAVPGLTGLYVGPSDLCLSLGLRPKPDQDDERFLKALDDVVSACQQNGIIAGVHASAGLADARRTSGFNMITVGFDHGPATQALASDLEKSRIATEQ